MEGPPAPPRKHTYLGPIVLGSFDVLAPIYPVDELVQRVIVDGLDVPQPVQRQDEVWAVLVIGDHSADSTLLAEEQEGGGCWREANGGGRASASGSPTGSGAGRTAFHFLVKSRFACAPTRCTWKKAGKTQNWFLGVDYGEFYSPCYTSLLFPYFISVCVILKLDIHFFSDYQDLSQKEGKVVNIQLPPISVCDALVTVGFARGFYVLQGMAENRVM